MLSGASSPLLRFLHEGGGEQRVNKWKLLRGREIEARNKWECLRSGRSISGIDSLDDINVKFKAHQLNNAGIAPAFRPLDTDRLLNPDPFRYWISCSAVLEHTKG